MARLTLPSQPTSSFSVSSVGAGKNPRKLGPEPLERLKKSVADMIPELLEDSGNDLKFYWNYEPLAIADAFQGGAPRWSERALEGVVGVALALAQDYLNGFQTPAKELSVEIDRIRKTKTEVENELKKSGGKIDEFSLDLFNTAQTLLKFVHERVVAGTLPSDALRKVLVSDEYVALKPRGRKTGAQLALAAPRG